MKLHQRQPAREHHVPELESHRLELMVNSDAKKCSNFAISKGYLVPCCLAGAALVLILTLWASNERFILSRDVRALSKAGLASAKPAGGASLTHGHSLDGGDGDRLPPGAHNEEAVRRRAVAAVLGALVADAATMGLHWIYDTEKIRALVLEHGRSEEPAFFQPPSCPYYQYESGSLSPYGDELLPVLQYMTVGPGSHQDGTLDGPGFAKFLAEYYANYTGRLNKSSRAMMEALMQGGHGWPECGDPRDTQANNFVKVVPLVARFAGQPYLMARAVDAAVRAQQNNDEAVMYGMVAALVLERVVMGSSISEAVEWAAAGAPGSGVALSRSALEALQGVLRHRNAGTPLRELVYGPAGAAAAGVSGGSGSGGGGGGGSGGGSGKAGVWGPSCANPGALQAALLGALQASSRGLVGRAATAAGVSSSSASTGGDGGGNGGGSAGGGGGDDTSFARGVRSNMLLGGDNCSRGVLLGALLAAEVGPAAIPFSWRSKTRVFHSSEVLAEQLVEFRSPAGGARRQRRHHHRHDHRTS